MDARDYKWHASGGRVIAVRDMTAEHLVNTLNYIERRPFPPRDQEAALKRDEDYFHLRCEAIRRGLRWRKFADIPPVRDGELINTPYGWKWKAKSAPQFDPQGQDSWEGINMESRAATEKPGIFDWLIGRRVSVSTCNGRLEKIELLPDDPEEVMLSQIKVGEHFRSVRHPGGIYMRVDPRGEIWHALIDKGHVSVEGAFVKGHTPRYAVAHVVTGAVFLRPGYEKVVRVPKT